MPTAPIYTHGMGRLEPFYAADKALEQAVNLAPSLTLAKGTVLGELTATPGTFKAYASGNSDGSQVPKCILRYDAVSDASGNITLGSGPAGTTEHAGMTVKAVDAFFSGYFKASELVGLDAAGLTAMGGHIVSGSITTGVVVISGV